MNYKKPYYIQFGPPIPVVHVGNFSRLPPSTLEQAWEIVGPAVQMNMQRNFRGQCLELWQIIAAAYLEGLHHGSSLEQISSRKNISNQGADLPLREKSKE